VESIEINIMRNFEKGFLNTDKKAFQMHVSIRECRGILITECR
jgi:hypothetical protein